MEHNTIELVAISSIGVALIMSVWFNYVEIATMLGSGPVGYIGGNRMAKLVGNQ